MHYEFRKIYAIRQSSKGWSDIIYVADSKEAAEALVKECYERTSSKEKTNYRIEKIDNLITIL